MKYDCLYSSLFYFEALVCAEGRLLVQSVAYKHWTLKLHVKDQDELADLFFNTTVI